MTVTITELSEKLKQIEETILLEILDINSEEIVENFYDKIENKYEELREDFEEEGEN